MQSPLPFHRRLTFRAAEDTTQLCGCGLRCPHSSEPPGPPRSKRTSWPPPFTVFPHLHRCQMAASLLERNLGASEPQDPRDSLVPSACCSVLTYWCHREAHGKSLLSKVKLWHLQTVYLLKNKLEQGKVNLKRGCKMAAHPVRAC